MTVAERRDPLDLKRANTVEKGHGRIETRLIAVRTALPLRLDQNWPGLTAICRIERRREHKDRCSREVIYAITSLPVDKCAPAGLLQLSRDHWQIENCLFHVRDVTFKEKATHRYSLAKKFGVGLERLVLFRCVYHRYFAAMSNGRFERQ